MGLGAVQAYINHNKKGIYLYAERSHFSLSDDLH